jgi:hypothetical protein
MDYPAWTPAKHGQMVCHYYPNPSASLPDEPNLAPHVEIRPILAESFVRTLLDTLPVPCEDTSMYLGEHPPHQLLMHPSLQLQPSHDCQFLAPYSGGLWRRGAHMSLDYQSLLIVQERRRVLGLLCFV